MQKLILALISYVLLMSPMAMAQDEINKCLMLKEQQNLLMRDRELLSKMNLLQNEKQQAEQLREHLLSGATPREIALFTEDQVNELALIAENEDVEAITGVASVGALMVTTYIIKRLNTDTRGQAFLKRLQMQLFPKKRIFVKSLLNTSFLLAIAGSLYSGVRIYQNQQKKKDLKSIINDLNELKDLSEKIVSMKDNIESQEIAYHLNAEELESQGLIKRDKNGQFDCP